MTKRNRYSLIIIVFSILALGIFFYLRPKSQDSLKGSGSVEDSSPSLKIDSETLSIDGRRVVGLQPGQEKEKIKRLKIVNKTSGNWKEALERTLRKQGGSAIKEIQMEVVDSLVWTQDEMGLFVESVVVTLRNEKNSSTTFRVLVDSQSGKILKNWDQPVIDPANPRESFRLKIDPRYHQEN